MSQGRKAECRFRYFVFLLTFLFFLSFILSSSLLSNLPYHYETLFGQD